MFPAMTDADIDSFSTAITRGAAAYLVKPVAAEEIVAVAHKISGWLHSSDRTEKRRRLRRPLLLRVDVEIKGQEGVFPGQIVDVSGSGCRIELKQPLAKGDTVRLTLYGVEGSIDLSLNAEVRWQRQEAVWKRQRTIRKAKDAKREKDWRDHILANVETLRDPGLAPDSSLRPQDPLLSADAPVSCRIRSNRIVIESA